MKNGVVIKRRSSSRYGLSLSTPPCSAKHVRNRSKCKQSEMGACVSCMYHPQRLTSRCLNEISCLIMHVICCQRNCLLSVWSGFSPAVGAIWDLLIGLILTPSSVPLKCAKGWFIKHKAASNWGIQETEFKPQCGLKCLLQSLMQTRQAACDPGPYMSSMCHYIVSRTMHNIGCYVGDEKFYLKTTSKIFNFAYDWWQIMIFLASFGSSWVEIWWKYTWEDFIDLQPSSDISLKACWSGYSVNLFHP